MYFLQFRKFSVFTLLPLSQSTVVLSEIHNQQQRQKIFWGFYCLGLFFFVFHLFRWCCQSLTCSSLSTCQCKWGVCSLVNRDRVKAMSCSWGSVMGRISLLVVWYFKMFYFIMASGVFDFLLLQSFFFNLLLANRLPRTPTKCHILHLQAYWSNVNVHRNSPSLPPNLFTFLVFCSLCQWHLGIGRVGKKLGNT